MSQEYPMLPSISPIQRCPKCGAYFFYEDVVPFVMTEEEFRKRLNSLIEKTRRNRLIMGYGGIEKYYR